MRAFLISVILVGTIGMSGCAQPDVPTRETTQPSSQGPTTTHPFVPSTTAESGSGSAGTVLEDDATRLCDYLVRITYEAPGDVPVPDIDFGGLDLPEELEGALGVVWAGDAGPSGRYQIGPSTTEHEVSPERMAEALAAIASWRDRTCGLLD